MRGRSYQLLSVRGLRLACGLDAAGRLRNPPRKIEATPRCYGSVKAGCGGSSPALHPQRENWDGSVPFDVRNGWLQIYPPKIRHAPHPRGSVRERGGGRPAGGASGRLGEAVLPVACQEELWPVPGPPRVSPRFSEHSPPTPRGRSRRPIALGKGEGLGIGPQRSARRAPTQDLQLHQERNGRTRARLYLWSGDFPQQLDRLELRLHLAI